MSVVNMVVGATTSDGATFVATVDTGPVRVAVATDEAVSSPVFTTSQAVDAQGVAKVSITGLSPSTRYWWQVEDNSALDASVTGQFVTLPPAGSQASFTVGLASCAGASPDFPGDAGGELAASRLSNSPIFDTIRTRALAENWLQFVHMGDLHYYDLENGGSPDSTVANYRTAYDDVLSQTNQAGLYRDVAWGYVWDDHDFGPDNSDGTHPDKANAAQVYRERVPHHPLDDLDGIWQSWQIGRVLFVASDVRFYRSPNSDPDGPAKTMLGADQKTWLDGLLGSTPAEVLVWVMPSQWLGEGADTWESFSTERDELVDLLDGHDWLRRTVMVYGDRHATGITSGATNTWGGFPVLLAASLDSTPTPDPDPDRFDVLAESPGREQYGTVSVTDVGTAITVRLAAWRGPTELGSYAFSVPVAQPVVVPDINRLLHGSHRPTVEARVLTTFQTGDDPDGVQVDVMDGAVSFDGTAEVFATLDLTTDGMDQRRRSRFPRLAGDLLAPYGHEVFVRRGVDTGPTVVWEPLGYFRLDDAEQAPASDGPIRLSGMDRMSGIIDGELVVPRQYAASATFRQVAEDLVRDVYPGAVVLFDDGTGGDPIGRQLIVEQDRYAALLDLAESLGKVVFWDGQGFLRIEDPPDPDELVWEITAGYHGVLIDVNRRVTREDMANAVVARGEGGDSSQPVQAVVVDAGVNSPTRWFAPDDPAQLWFGQVPHFYSSPLITTSTQALTAGRSLLRRRIGLPYRVDWGSVVNPALRPRQAVRIAHKDGTRERHLVETNVVPLAASRHMTGSTREQTLVSLTEVATSTLGGS